MATFTMPADFRAETIDAYRRFNDDSRHVVVDSTYGNLTVGNRVGSGRDVAVLPRTDLDQLAAYVAASRAAGIDFCYTVNATTTGNREFDEPWLADYMAFIRQLHGLGIDTFIVALPSLLEPTRAVSPRIRIKSSVLCETTNASKARLQQGMGADGIVIDESVYRDFAEIERIRRAFSGRVEVIVNTVCHKNCQYRMFHYNQISMDAVDHCNPVSADFYRRRCIKRAWEDLGVLMRVAWIRPEDLCYYEGRGVSAFKVQGRPLVGNGDPIRFLRAYDERRYDGNLVDLLYLFSPLPEVLRPIHLDNRKLDGFIDTFHRRESYCKDDCETCHYCDGYAKKALNWEALTQMQPHVVAAIDAGDPFRVMLGRIESGTPG